MSSTTGLLLAAGGAVAALCCGSCLAADTAASRPGNLIFRSGFEPDTMVVAAGTNDDIVGVDRSVPPPNDWVAHLEGHPKLGLFNIQYQGGTAEDRHARIVPDPTQPGNHVLQFWLKNPRVPAGPNRFKARIQANVYGNTDLTEVFSRRRLYLHPDCAILRRIPESFGWLTLEELWLAAGWINHPHPFRISLNLRKDAGVGKPLHFTVHGQMWDAPRERWHPTVWDETNRGIEVPIGTWITLETYYRQGTDASGRFHLAARFGPDAERQVIFDRTAWTYSPAAPEPVPMTHWNPMKLYTSSALVDFVREAGGVLQVAYDDFEIWDGWPADVAAP